MIESAAFTDESGRCDTMAVLRNEDGWWGYGTSSPTGGPTDPAYMYWYQTADELAAVLAMQAHSDQWSHHGDDVNAWLLRVSMDLRTAGA